MENKIEQSNNEKLSFVEKYGIWIIVITMIGILIGLKIIISFI
jgi:hypothetical protein